jgi:hypothetical protein
MRTARAIAAAAIVCFGCSGHGEAPVVATDAGGAVGSGGAGTGGAVSAGSAGTGGAVGGGGADSGGGSGGVSGTIAAAGGAAGVTAAGGYGAATAVDGGGGTDASSAGSGGADSGRADVGYACTPSGTICHENGPNPSPIAPPNTPCCDGVCNHATNHCGCSAAGGPCSSLDFLYGPDCCPGLQCLDTGSASVCGVCRPNGAPCTAAGVCCTGICNSLTNTCGSSAVGGPCTDSRDCSGQAYCSSAHQCVVDTVCTGDGASCIASSECCSQICNTVSSTCGCGYAGTGCTTNSDCCATASATLCNSARTCGCLADGKTCGVPADCCTGVCNGASGQCGCSAIGAFCVGAGDCCGGLTCGAARTCCKASGQPCSLGAECCGGNCKGNGTCS